MPALDVLRADARVDVALAHPHHQLAARDLLEPETEEEVGQEQDLLIGRDRLDHAARVAGGAAVVALGLHLGARVDVRDDDGPRVPRLPGAQLVGRDRGGERAAGLGVGDQDGLLGREDRGCLGHEVHAAERDRRGLVRGGLARESERVAHVVGDVLHLGDLVVVREDHRVARTRELADLLLQRGDARGLGRGRHVTSRETWSERAP